MVENWGEARCLVRYSSYIHLLCVCDPRHLMLPRSVTRLLKSLGRFRDPKPLSLDEWAEHHRPRVMADVQRVLPYIPDGSNFVDVGANVGLFTECILQERPGCAAVLFEPVLRYYERCSQRFEGNPRVQVIHAGLGAEADTATIYKPRHNFGGNTIVRELFFDRSELAQLKSDTPFDEEEVKIEVFSDVAEQLGITDISFVKTDAEGHDHAVLAGMLPWLATQAMKPVILAELLAEFYHPHWAEQAAALDGLTRVGYAECDLSRMEKIDDILLFPSDYSHPEC